MTPSFKPLDQQVIVITGASSGIGLATAGAAASQGAKVVLVARSEDTLADIAAEICATGGQARYVAADVADADQLAQAVQVAIDAFGAIDTWVNDAGVTLFGRLDEGSKADNRRLFDINFWGVVHGSLIALPYLKAHGGALINLGSEASESVLPLQGMYAASKHAIKGFTDALRVEVEEIDQAPVSVTLIQPTAADTPIAQHARNYQDQEAALPTPQIDPYRVAGAILDAATHHRNDVKVGMMAHLNTTMHELLPGLAKKLEALQANRQHYAEPPRQPEGTLYRPGGSGHVHGSGGAPAH